MLKPKIEQIKLVLARASKYSPRRKHATGATSDGRSLGFTPTNGIRIPPTGKKLRKLSPAQEHRIKTPHCTGTFLPKGRNHDDSLQRWENFSTKHLTARAPISRRTKTRATLSNAGTLLNKTPHRTGAYLPKGRNLGHSLSISVTLLNKTSPRTGA